MVALLRNLADFATEIHFGREKPKHANAPNMITVVHETETFNGYVTINKGAVLLGARVLGFFATEINC